MAIGRVASMVNGMIAGNDRGADKLNRYLRRAMAGNDEMCAGGASGSGIEVSRPFRGVSNPFEVVAKAIWTV
jgi:hypothetical protein